MKKDNSTLARKTALRHQALKHCADGAQILETHGGFGRIYERCYDNRRGVVIEKDAKKAEFLAAQRCDWRVYQGDCIKALGAGIGADIPFGLIDCDPYGSPFDVLEAIFKPERNFTDELQLVVNDGLRQKIILGGAWQTKCLRRAVEKHGNDLYPIYIEVCAEMVTEIVEPCGFVVAGFYGYYTGHNNNMTHYWARLKRDAK